MDPFGSQRFRYATATLASSDVAGTQQLRSRPLTWQVHKLLGTQLTIQVPDLAIVGSKYTVTVRKVGGTTLQGSDSFGSFHHTGSAQFTIGGMGNYMVCFDLWLCLTVQITIIVIVSTILLIVVVIGISVGVHNANVDKKLEQLSKKGITVPSRQLP